MSKSGLISIVLLVISVQAWAGKKHHHGHSHKHHKAHVHGQAKMNLGLQGQELEIEFEIPSESLVGFEHQAKTEEQKKQIQSVLKQLKSAEKVISFNAEAGCELKDSEVESELLKEKHHDHGHKHKEDHDGEAHSEFEIKYKFACKSEKDVQTVEVNLFETYKRLNSIKAQVVTSSRQTSVELKQDNKIISLK